MQLLLLAVVLILIAAVASLASARRPRLASIASAVGVVVASAVGLVAAVGVVLSGDHETFRRAWSLPLGEFHLALDALSAWFLVPIFVLSALAAVYGVRYLAHDSGPRVAVSWSFYCLLVAGMVMVVLAHDGMLFLLAWEIMSLASFFLVAYDDRRESVRRAAWVYLVATHIGTAALIVLFLLLGRASGTLDFDRFAPGAAPGAASLCFVLAVIGFGTKAGFMPLHVWLPEAHPAAPSHVSALMSGVMIKTGVYGLIRLITLIGPPPVWWGLVLVAIGLSSGALGILFAIAQHDLKRLLAYSSVENIGIIALGLGLGLLGSAFSLPVVAQFGFAAVLLHVVNHALFKGLLFLSAGSVLHATGTAGIDRLGGLIKRMPRTGVAFLIGAAAICGLPPLNGFISELLVFLGSLRAILDGNLELGAVAAAVIAVLALIGGLAVVCFTKAFGIIFLGEPRSPEAVVARESGWPMTLPMAVLALACIAVGLTAPWLLAVVMPAPLAVVTAAPAADFAQSVSPLTGVVAVSAILIALILVLAALRRLLLRGRTVERAVTWDCGYLRPTPRMQYTASSFARPIVDLFRAILRPHRKAADIVDLFPTAARLETHTGDLFADRLIAPLFHRIQQALSHLRRIQHGQVRLYVLYIALTLLILLIWKLH